MPEPEPAPSAPERGQSSIESKCGEERGTINADFNLNHIELTYKSGEVEKTAELRGEPDEGSFRSSKIDYFYEALNYHIKKANPDFVKQKN